MTASGLVAGAGTYEDGATEVDVVLDETHAAVAGPALLVVVPNQVLVVWVRVRAEVALDEVA